MRSVHQKWRFLAVAGIFLSAALPFQLYVAPFFSGLASGIGRTTAKALGPGRELVRSGDEFLEIDRSLAVDEFFDDPEQRPPGYALLLLWSWIAVAPGLGGRKRLAIAATVSLALVVVHALALTCDALAWYRGSVALQVPAAPTEWQFYASLLDKLARALWMAALLILPLCLAVRIQSMTSEERT